MTAWISRRGQSENGEKMGSLPKFSYAKAAAAKREAAAFPVLLIYRQMKDANEAKISTKTWRMRFCAKCRERKSNRNLMIAKF